MMIDLLATVIVNLFGTGIGQLGLVIGFVAVGLYWRKMLGLGSIFATWGGRIAFTAVVIGVLLALGISDGLDVDAAMDLGNEIAAIGKEVWTEVTG